MFLPALMHNTDPSCELHIPGRSSWQRVLLEVFVGEDGDPGSPQMLQYSHGETYTRLERSRLSRPRLRQNLIQFNDCCRIDDLTSHQFIQAITKILNIPWPSLCCEAKNSHVNPKMSLNVLAALGIVQYILHPISELLGKI